MAEQVKTKTFDGRHKNHRVRLTYRDDKHSIRIVCSKPEVGADYLRKLITSNKIGHVDAVIFSTRRDSKVVALMRGNGLDTFLRSGMEDTKPLVVESKKSFSELAEEQETGS